MFELTSIHNSTGTSIIIVVLLVLTILWYIVLRPRRGNTNNPPPLVTYSKKFPIPYIGHLIEFFSSPHEMMKRCYNDYGPIFTIPIFHKRLTFLIGPDAQKIFFTASDDVLSQNEVYDFMRPIFGPNVVYDAPKKYRQVQYQATASGLKTNRLRAYVTKIEEETRQYLHQYWNNNTTGEIDLLKSLSEITILTASRCLHGDDVRKHMFKDVQELYHDLDSGLTPLTVFWPTAPTVAHKKRDAARQEMIRLFENVITERKNNPSQSDGTDIFSLYMNIKYKDGTPVTVEEVTGLLIALLFAGQHTSCISSTWTSLFIANDTTLIDRIMKEQETILNGDFTKKLDYDLVNDMELLHNCMKEALRMCPTFIMILRRAECNIPIEVNTKQYTIPEGDYVVVSPTVAMRLKDTFVNPDTFDPDRYSIPREEHKIPYAYLGFGGGQHSCMGQQFAFVQVKTILSIIFREYTIERISSSMPDIGYNDMVVGPKGDCRIRYTKRNNTTTTK